MYGIGIFLVLMLAGSILHAVAMSTMGVIAKVRAEEVGIGFGPKLFGFHLAGCLIRFNLVLPFNAYVKFDEVEVRKLGRYGIAVMSLISPSLVSMVVALLLIGPQDAFAAAVDGGTTFFVGGSMPWAVGADTWDVIYQATNQQPVLKTAGIMFAVMAAINLIPLPPLPGARVIVALFIDSRKERGLLSVLETLMILTYFLLVLSWLVAIGVAIVRWL